MTNHKEHRDKAMLDPGDLYRSPKAVAQDESLEIVERLEILENWANQVQQVLNSEAENMHPDLAKYSEANLLQEIKKEIVTLTGE
ncbi:MAG: hypothetical protein WBS20_15335 [Lysobacterales bacterium]